MHTSRFTPLRLFSLLGALIALAAAPAWAATNTDPGGGEGGGGGVAPPTITGGPTEGSTITTRTPTFTFSGGSAYECSIADTPSYTACDSGSFTPPALGDGDYTFRVRAVEGEERSTAATLDFNVDATGPSVSFGFSSPFGRVNGGTFTFSSPDVDETYECQINSSAWIDCNFGYSLPGSLSASLVQGAQNTFRVRATDVHGNAGPIATRIFTWDTIAPDTAITPIESPVTVRRPQIAFEAPSDGASYTYYCTLVTGTTAGNEVQCGSGTAGGTWQPTADLDDGSYTLRVRARDAAQNWEFTPASFSFGIDATAPVIAFADGSAAGTVTTGTPTFAMTSDDPNTTYLCKVGSGAFEPCASPFTTQPLANGPHLIEIKGLDAAGNESNVLTRLITVAVPAEPVDDTSNGDQSTANNQSTGNSQPTGNSQSSGGGEPAAGRGESALQCVVPKLKGKRLRRARKLLAKANCATGRVKKRKAAKRKRGKVLRQPKKAGTILPAGTKIRLVVGRRR